MQLWLRVGLLFLLTAMGCSLIVASVLEVRDRSRFVSALAVMGASTARLRQTLAAEFAVRQSVMLASAAVSGGAVTIAARGWTSADPLPPGWLTGFFSTLCLIAVAGVVAPVLAQSVITARERGTGTVWVDRPGR